MRNLLIILFVWALWGCEQEPMQFFPQNKYFLDDDINEGYRTDVIVMVSPPKNNLELIKVVNEYVKKITAWMKFQVTKCFR